MASDFNALYASLGVDPDCDVDTLKQLFRRRIAELHPDRGAMSEEELMQLYLEALRFHRRHGRFPGARARAAPPSRLPGNLVARQELVALPPVATTGGSARHVRAVTLLALLGLVLLGLGIWAIDDGKPVTARTSPLPGATAG